MLPWRQKMPAEEEGEKVRHLPESAFANSWYEMLPLLSVSKRSKSWRQAARKPHSPLETPKLAQCRVRHRP